MLPVPFTTIAPSSIFHFAGLPLSPCHWLRSLPSKRTRASEGGGPALMIRGSTVGSGTGPAANACGRRADDAKVRTKVSATMFFINAVTAKRRNRSGAMAKATASSVGQRVHSRSVAAGETPGRSFCRVRLGEFNPPRPRRARSAATIPVAPPARRRGGSSGAARRTIRPSRVPCNAPAA